MENKKELRNWLDAFNLDHPLVIAGPCSAETEEQVLKIAHELKDTDATVFRAGIWKPRTRPGMFEGVGALGLKWLQKAKEETGMLTTTEVANPNHVELALKHDVDILWIGARTTVSPFNIQEIAEALKGFPCASNRFGAGVICTSTPRGLFFGSSIIIFHLPASFSPAPK